MDVIYESKSYVDRKQTLTGEVYETELGGKRAAFDVKFEETFKLKGKFPPEEIELAKSIFSNLIGEIFFFLLVIYFHGCYLLLSAVMCVTVV